MYSASVRRCELMARQRMESSCRDVTRRAIFMFMFILSANRTLSREADRDRDLPKNEDSVCVFLVFLLVFSPTQTTSNSQH